jgi:acetylornithine/succinyldiaminopimelate/putrescine aminotransferase
MPSIARVGEYFRERLGELARKHAVVKEIRGVGLMIGMDLTHPCKHLVLEGIKEGLLFNCTHDTVLRFLPAYILTEKDVDKGITGLKKVLKNFKPADTAPAS